LGLDETSFLRATPTAPTRYVTGLVDVEGGRLLDVIADRTTRAVTAWLSARPQAWLAGVGTVALDPWRGYASALVAPLGHATVVVDHFHAIKLANTVVDQVRRRTQQALLGHRGRKHDPLYRIRKLLLRAAERLTSRGRARLRAGLTAGDPTGEVAAAWQGKELLRAVYAAGDLASARAALDRFYRWCDGVQLLELSRLARTVRLADRDPGLAPDRRLLQRRHRGDQLADQEGEAGRPRLPQLRQLPAAGAAVLRRQVADSPHRKTAKPLTTFGGVEPIMASFPCVVQA
jgi:transposase